jgi:hypothetical protein
MRTEVETKQNSTIGATRTFVSEDNGKEQNTLILA